MDKSRQQQLLRWLKDQSLHSQGWLQLSLLLGIFSALLILLQAWLLATLLQQLIVDSLPRESVIPQFILLFSCFLLRALLAWLREKVGFTCGKVIRKTLRRQILDRLEDTGPAIIRGKPVGSWATLLLEQVEDMQDYYSRYLPQMRLAAIIPCFILIGLVPVNWAAAMILLVAAPLIPLFMVMVGIGAAEANRRNFRALARLSGHFLDRLRGLDTLRLFHRAEAETLQIGTASAEFRQRTMEVLRLAFLSSAVLEFFASISIAVVAVYFGFSYLGELNFGHYGTGVTLFAGFFALLLAPEFFQPLRDLGTYYHAKAQAVGGADALEQFLCSETSAEVPQGVSTPDFSAGLNITAEKLIITTRDGVVLAGPLSFFWPHGKRIALVGKSGAGKTSLLNVLLGHLPYRGSLQVNGTELRDLHPEYWQRQLAWVGQNPHLPAATIEENIAPNGSVDSQRMQRVCQLAGVNEFLDSGRLNTAVELITSLSVGQAQRIAVARALYKPCWLLLLDEPDASLDHSSEQRVNQALHKASFAQSTLLITHQLNELDRWDEIWVMQDGKIVQQGNRGQLLQVHGPFAALASRREERVE